MDGGARRPALGVETDRRAPRAEGESKGALRLLGEENDELCRTTEEALLRLASCNARKAEARDRMEWAEAIIREAHVDRETTRRKCAASE